MIRAPLSLALTALLAITSSHESVAQTYVAGGSPGTMINLVDGTVRERPPSALRPFPVLQAWFNSTESSSSTRWTKRIKELISVSCEMEKIANLSSVEYLPNDKMGNSFERNDTELSYSYAVPGSAGYAMVEFLCAQ